MRATSDRIKAMRLVLPCASSALAFSMAASFELSQMTWHDIPKPSLRPCRDARDFRSDQGDAIGLAVCFKRIGLLDGGVVRALANDVARHTEAELAAVSRCARLQIGSRRCDRSCRVLQAHWPSRWRRRSSSRK